MSQRDIALAFLKHFCAGEIEEMAPLLAADLRFEGPLYRFNSAREYLAALRNDPPEPCHYEILSITESADSVALFYDYQKPNGSLAIAQLFTMGDQRIQAIRLVFDTGRFA